MALRLLSRMMPHLAGNISLNDLRLLAAALRDLRLSPMARERSTPQVYYSLCPTICRSAAEISYRLAGAPVPRPARLKRLLSHVLNRWPEPITAASLARALDISWQSEALKLLWPLVRGGLLEASKVNGHFIFRTPG